MPDSPAEILIVDDESTIRELLTRALRQAGYNIHTAADGEIALEHFQAHTFDLIITDLKMPRMDGEQLVQRVRALAPHIPVLVLTGHGSVEAEERLHALGVSRVLYKPLRSLAELVSLVKQLLKP